MDRKGVSPIVATVLLIAIVIVIAAIIFLWARGFVKEAITKQGKPAYQVCQDINVRAAIQGDNLELTNNGNIPLYMIDIRKTSGGNVDIFRYAADTGSALNAGESISVEDDSGSGFSSYDKIELVPAILGESGNQRQIKFCTENTIIV